MRLGFPMGAALACSLLLFAAPLPAQIRRAEDVVKRMGAMGQTRFGASQPADFQNHDGFTALFDGRTLDGWDGSPDVWRVENGMIVGVRPPGPGANNDYLTYRKTRAKDFDLKVEIRVAEGGSGIQYRSRTGEPWQFPVSGAAKPVPKWMLSGPQADIWAAVPPRGEVYDGQVFIENSPRGIVAWRGEVTQEAPPGRARILGTIGDPVALHGHVSTGWNEYEVVARGPVVMHILNGQLMAVHIDDDPKSPDNQPGLIGFEAEFNPARVEIRQVWLKVLDK